MLSCSHRSLYGLTAIWLLTVALPVSGAEWSSRLKFRSHGSVCSCDSGMGEAQISEAFDRLGSEKGAVSMVKEQPKEMNAGKNRVRNDEEQLRREADDSHEKK